jgi:Zn-dependent M32 family carboxypeptidase
MKKNKTILQAYQPILFEKTDQKDKKGKILYIPISKVGNGNRMLEIYKDDQESILPSNVMQMDTKAALTAAEGYKSAKDLMREPEFIKAMEQLKGEKTQNNGLKALAEKALRKVKDNNEVDETISKKEEESVKCNKGKA